MNNRILSRDEIYKILITALMEKTPVPPDDWCRSQLDEELLRATREYEPEKFVRQNQALETSLFYLADYARRMPERVNLTESNDRVKKMCKEVASEIVKITLRPDSVIKERGKLKSWLYAILSVNTCLIYREETDRYIAEQDELKRLRRIARQKRKPIRKTGKTEDKWQSDLAKTVFQKAVGTTNNESSEQPSLF